MATTVPKYDDDRTGKAAATGGAAGFVSGALAGAGIGASIGSAGAGVAAIPGAIIGGIIGGVLGGAGGATVSGVNEDAAQKTEIKSASTQRRAEKDAELDMTANTRAGKTLAAPGEDVTAFGVSSPYSGGSAYDTWHAGKYGS